MASFHVTLPEPLAAEPRAAARPRDVGMEGAPAFEAVYEAHFDLVYRNLRRLGVPDALVDDAVQEVFLVVYRRLGAFEGRSSLKTWICSIVTRVASDHRRALRRKSPHACKNAEVVDVDAVPDERAEGPHEAAERNEGARLLHALLDELDFDKRTALVLAELEGMTAPEIADALGENVNTVYARLRAARRDFEAAVSRVRARDAWRLR